MLWVLDLRTLWDPAGAVQGPCCAAALGQGEPHAPGLRLVPSASLTTLVLVLEMQQRWQQNWRKMKSQQQTGFEAQEAESWRGMEVSQPVWMVGYPSRGHPHTVGCWSAGCVAGFWALCQNALHIVLLHCARCVSCYGWWWASEPTQIHSSSVSNGMWGRVCVYLRFSGVSRHKLRFMNNLWILIEEERKLRGERNKLLCLSSLFLLEYFIAVLAWSWWLSPVFSCFQALMCYLLLQLIRW